jgi:hypothetical protein
MKRRKFILKNFQTGIVSSIDNIEVLAKLIRQYLE